MKNKLALTFLFLLGVFLYGLTLKGVKYNVQPSDIKGKLDQATEPLELSPERGRFVQVIALVDDHTYALNQQLADAAYPDVGVYKNKFFSFFAPGVSYLSVLFYKLGENINLSQVGTFTLVAFVSILSLLFIFKISREILKLSVWASLAAVLIFAFGSTTWSYAVTLYEHMFTVLFMMASFYGVWKYSQQKTGSWLWAILVWVCYALGIFVDYPNALLMLPIMVYFLIVSVKIFQQQGSVKISIRPAILTTFLAFIIVIGFHFYHNAHYFGSWKSISSTLVGVKTLEERKASTPQEIEALAKKKTVQSFFSERNIPFSSFTLLISGDRGIIFYSPIFLLAILGMYLARKELKLEHGILLSLVSVNILLYSSWGDPWGGWAFGPRYLIPSMAVLALFVGIFLAKMPKFWAKFLTLILFMYSSAVALIGALTTNAVPPKVEALPLHTGYNFLYNWQLLKQGKSSSFIYKYYLHSHLTLFGYFMFLYILLVIIMLIVLFILPKFDHDHKPAN